VATGFPERLSQQLGRQLAHALAFALAAAAKLAENGWVEIDRGAHDA
jgi:hypothetical protein